MSFLISIVLKIMSNFLSLISYAFSALAMVYGLWFVNVTYIGFSFTPSKLEKILKIGVTTKSDIAYFTDIGGLTKDSAYYGLNISGTHFTYDENTDKLKGWILSTTYKTTGFMSAAAPADVRAALNKACEATDSQWVMTDISSAFSGNNLDCLYYKDGDRYILSASIKPTSSPAPITSSASIITLESTKNNNIEPTKINDNSCVEENLKIYTLRNAAQWGRIEKEAQANGEEVRVPSAGQISRMEEDARKSAVTSCSIEKDALTTGTPSFDCDLSQRIDQLICSNKELAALDVKLSNSFKSVRYFSKDKDAFLKDTREWLVKRQECQDANCLVGMYNSRIMQLQKIIE